MDTVFAVILKITAPSAGFAYPDVLTLSIAERILSNNDFHQAACEVHLNFYRLPITKAGTWGLDYFSDAQRKTAPDEPGMAPEGRKTVVETRVAGDQL